MKTREKGNSIIALPEKFIAIDLETTGLDPEFDEIIEICAVKIENNEIKDTFVTLIKPSEKIDPFIEELTGITNDMLVSAPKIETVLDDLKDFLNDSILLGYNVNFDINFLYDNFLYYKKIHFNNDFIDILRIARKLLKQLDNHRLKDLKKHFNIKAINEHRALDDVNVTIEIFNLLKKEALLQFENEENLIKAFRKKYNPFNNLKASQIVSENSEFDETHPIYNKNFAFTGTLEKMNRKSAMQIVVDFGGKVTDGVTFSTNFLVIGKSDYSRFADGVKSSKLKKAEKLIIEGHDLKIISESVFYDLIES